MLECIFPSLAEEMQREEVVMGHVVEVVEFDTMSEVGYRWVALPIFMECYTFVGQ
jgi:hypothetical protein